MKVRENEEHFSIAQYWSWYLNEWSFRQKRVEKMDK
jgi:hypothetical protein